jgi:hypothetical protein
MGKFLVIFLIIVVVGILDITFLGHYATLLMVGILLGAWLFGKGLAALLKDDHRKIVGGTVVIVIGAALLIYGIASFNSTSSRLAASLGQSDTSAIASMAVGVFLALVGFLTLIARGRGAKSVQPATVKKCPYCAETIQLEAKLCRFCGKTLDTAPTT